MVLFPSEPLTAYIGAFALWKKSSASDENITPRPRASESSRRSRLADGEKKIISSLMSQRARFPSKNLYFAESLGKEPLSIAPSERKFISQPLSGRAESRARFDFPSPKKPIFLPHSASAVIFIKTTFYYNLKSPRSQVEYGKFNKKKINLQVFYEKNTLLCLNNRCILPFVRNSPPFVIKKHFTITCIHVKIKKK